MFKETTVKKNSVVSKEKRGCWLQNRIHLNAGKCENILRSSDKGDQNGEFMEDLCERRFMKGGDPNENQCDHGGVGF